ncbi:hypothetical protein BS47DRAFT_1345805 [Hydnum rufescens UP504]|uniref:Metallo-beta-lactamase domain-containing protein n=1 Tax=Hydnum rufescens UP504 TaxID=1448309 RepID=A0A9P6AUI1_9AGAM|nr:hypothetical protein BS47DRAFT_1345805 [Hydnum rufescens UP504]
MGGSKSVDSLVVKILVDDSVEWITAPPPGFSSEVTHYMRNSPPIDDEITGLPYLDLENFCCGAHGLAFLITTQIGEETHTILFDAGPESKSIERNLKALKVETTSIERIVLSHWHADHSGGILTALRLLNRESSVPLPVDLHPDRPVARGIAPPPTFKPWSRLPPDPTFAEIEQAGGAVELHAEGHNVADGHVWVSGEIERKTSWEEGILGGIQWVDGKWEREPGQLIMDERYIVVDVKEKGLVIFSSCSHAGIVNVLVSARENFPSRPVHMILGGLHLLGPELAYRIEPTIDAISEFDPDYVVPLHCTGFNAKVALRNKLGSRIVPGSAGMVVVVGSGAAPTSVHH